MKQHTSRRPSVLAVAPSPDGFGFAVFEGPNTLIDWGVRYIAADKNKQCTEKVVELIAWYQPSIIVIEDYAGEGSSRRKRIGSLLRIIGRRADKLGLRVHRYSRGRIRKCFAPFHATTKYQIAKKLAVWLPQELKPVLPKPHKLWEAEHSKMALFDAVSLGITYFNEIDEGAFRDRNPK